MILITNTLEMKDKIEQEIKTLYKGNTPPSVELFGKGNSPDVLGVFWLCRTVKNQTDADDAIAVIRNAAEKVARGSYHSRPFYLVIDHTAIPPSLACQLLQDANHTVDISQCLPLATVEFTGASPLGNLLKDVLRGADVVRGVWKREPEKWFKVGEVFKIGREDFTRRRASTLFGPDGQKLLSEVKSRIKLASAMGEKGPGNVNHISALKKQFSGGGLGEAMAAWDAIKTEKKTYRWEAQSLPVPTGTACKDLKAVFERRNPNAVSNHFLLRGETGSGKGLLVHSIHKLFYGDNPGTAEEVCELSCPNLGKETAEIELFGSLAGTFTDAKSRPGKIFESCYNGTLFLDEIADMPMDLQVRLLKFLDTGEVYPVGWNHDRGIYVPCMVIAATNKNLFNEIKKGNFRADLFYRLNGSFPLHIPSLHSRIQNEAEWLVDVALQNPLINPDGEIKAIERTAIERLKGYPFEGNFRDFEAVLRRAVQIAGSMGADAITLEILETALPEGKH